MSLFWADAIMHDRLLRERAAAGAPQDMPLPIGHSKTISAPHMHATALEIYRNGLEGVGHGRSASTLPRPAASRSAATGEHGAMRPAAAVAPVRCTCASDARVHHHLGVAPRRPCLSSLAPGPHLEGRARAWLPHQARPRQSSTPCCPIP